MGQILSDYGTCNGTGSCDIHACDSCPLFIRKVSESENLCYNTENVSKALARTGKYLKQSGVGNKKIRTGSCRVCTEPVWEKEMKHQI